MGERLTPATLYALLESLDDWSMRDRLAAISGAAELLTAYRAWAARLPANSA